MNRLITTVVILLVLALTPLSCQPKGIKVGSKKFTESVILGEMIKSLADDAGVSAPVV